jgi:hypothetical protein
MTTDKGEETMLGQNFVVGYVKVCTGGQLPLSECGPVWQLGIISVLLVLAVLMLVAVRVGRSLTSSQS